jgi:HlyD family secretion protein
MRRLALLAVLALAACGGSSGADEAIEGSTHRVTRGPLRITISEKGTLQEKNSVEIRSLAKNPAKIVQLHVKEGASVQEGDLLIELAKESFEKEVKDLEDSILQLETEQKSAATDVEIQRSDNQSAVQKAMLKLELAQKEKERYEKGDRLQEERKRKLRVETAVSDLSRAREKAKELPALLKEGFITQVDFEEEQIKIRKLEEELETARLDLKLWETYGDPIEIRKRETDVDEAERELERAKTLAESRLTAKQVVLKQKQRRLQAAQEKLEEATQQLELMTIRAPAPGIVVYEKGGRRNPFELKVGETAYPRRTLMRLPDLSVMQVELEIHEADIAKLRKGLDTTVVLESNQSVVLNGKVTQIATVGSSSSWWDDTKKFTVIIEILDNLAEKGLDLRPGLTARTEILIDEIPDTLAVPLQAIHASKGEFYCWVIADGDPARRTIRPGRSNDNYVQVLEGLAEGDEVLLYDPESREQNGNDEDTGNGPTG